MTDDLLTEFRSDVSLPDETTARRAYERAMRSQPKLLTRRRLAIAGVVAAAAVAGGLSATLGGASSNVNPQRQRVVQQAMRQVQQAFGGNRIRKATLDGSLLKVDVKEGEPYNSVLGPFEGLILIHVANEQLRAAGYEGVDTYVNGRSGPNQLSPFPAPPQLPADACDIPVDTQLADTTSASGRVIPLLGGFCDFRLTTSHPRSFDANAILNQLSAAVPASDQGAARHRAEVCEVYGENGKPVFVVAWDGGTNEGGAEYIRPGLAGLPTP
jgi:Domain of unknown function (DUF1918)